MSNYPDICSYSPGHSNKTLKAENNWPFIWKNFSQTGYITSYMDNVDHSIFPGQKESFRPQVRHVWCYFILSGRDDNLC